MSATGTGTKKTVEMMTLPHNVADRYHLGLARETSPRKIVFDVHPEDRVIDQPAVKAF